MSDTYYTIANLSEGTYSELRSKFVSFAFHVETIEEAKDLIKEYSKKYYDARHVCWAYMLGWKREVFLSSDNGEPSGTAGKPILGQINSYGLTNILIIVVRYFGGVKLGTSGLIQAYRSAAKSAIENAQIVKCHQMSFVEFSFPYIVMNSVMKIIKQPLFCSPEDLQVVGQQFDNLCRIKLGIRNDYYDHVVHALTGIEGVMISE